MEIAIIGILLIVLAVLSVVVIKGVYPLPMHLHKSVYQTKGVALSGTDVVALYDDDTVLTGDPTWSLEYTGTHWYFVSRKNLEKFRADPKRYMPQFGGYCTYAVSKGFTAPARANHRFRQDGRIFLFSNQAVLAEALKNFEKTYTAAEKKWK